VLVDSRNRDIIKGGHHLLRQPDILVLIAHFHTGLRIATGRMIAILKPYSEYSESGLP